MKALKFFVVLGGILIAIGLVVVSVEILRQTKKMVSSEQQLANGPIHTWLDLPRNTQIDAPTIVADRIVIKAVLPQGETRFYILDSTKGQPVGIISSLAEPQKP